MHVLEHKLDPRLYKASHKPHHRFTNPRLFDAFNGSPADTFLMILVPLLVTKIHDPLTLLSTHAHELTTSLVPSFDESKCDIPSFDCSEFDSILLC